VPAANHNDLAGKELKGKVVVYLGQFGPASIDQRQAMRALFGRSRTVIEEQKALAAIGPTFSFSGGRGGQGGGRQGQSGQAGGSLPEADFTTAQSIDNPIAPAVSAQDEFYEFLFSGSDVKYAELKDKAAKREPLPAFALKNARITFNIDADYTVVRTQYTRNVVGIIEGADAKLKDTYVAYGAHYDHVGYAEGEVEQGQNGARRLGARGRVTKGAEDDRIWNGADDDGSGSVAMLDLSGMRERSAAFGVRATLRTSRLSRLIR
jgi:hypothetical protein